jgi:anaerobic magnesium-protoporphyrin IX monomethyl ester cyclase
MKVHLVIPPCAFLIDDRVFPFLGPLQIGALARELGHEVRVSDLTGYKRRHPEAKQPSVEDVVREATSQLLGECDWQPDLVGFYALAPQMPYVHPLHEAVREFLPDVPTAIGGPHANTDPGACEADGFDFVVVADQGGGGGEPGMIRALDEAEKKRREFRRKSHAWFQQFRKPEVIKEPSRTGAQWENDRWPLPARDLIDMSSYRYTIKGERAATIVTATGCPYACTYCSHWEGYRKLEGKSAGRVAEEIRSVKRDYGWRAWMAYDDEINLRPDFTTEFLPMMKAQNIVWRAFFKNGKNLTRHEVFEAMAASGCVQLCTGAESANDQILKDIRKGATREHNTQFVEYCVRYGIEPKVFTQVGLPGETPESVQELRDWIVNDLAPRGLRDFDVTITTPMAGTPIYDHPEKHKIHFDKKRVSLGLYKTVPGEYVAGVWHDRLTQAELVVARQWVEDEGRKAIGLAPLVAKDDG